MKKLDLFNLMCPFPRIEAALKGQQQFLVELRLSSCKIISAECKEIASSPLLSQLRALDLSCNSIKLSGLVALIDH